MAAPPAAPAGSEQDSLRSVLASESNDSLVVEALFSLTWTYLGSDLDSAVAIGRRASEGATRRADLDQMAAAERNLGIARLYQGENRLALEHFQRALTHCEALEDPRKIAGAVNNVALAQQELGNFDIALDYHQRGLRIKQDLGDSSRIHISLNNIGLIYEKLEDYHSARSYYRQSLEFPGAPKDSLTSCTNFSNIGGTYFSQGVLDSAMYWYERSLQYAEGIGDKRMIGIQHLHFAKVYQIQGKAEAAKSSALEAIQQFTALGKKDKMTDTWLLLGQIALDQGQHTQAKSWCSRALTLATETAYIEGEVACLECLSQAEKGLGNLKQALVHLERYHLIRDSLRAHDLLEAVLRKDVAFSYEQEKLADSLENARVLAVSELNHQKDVALKDLEHRNEVRKQVLTSWIIGLLGILFLVIAIVLYRTYQRKRKLSLLLEEKVRLRTKELEQKNGRLADYAFINAHLLRGPLAQMMGLVTLLREATSEEERQEYLRLLQQAATKLDGVIHDIAEVVEAERISSDSESGLSFHGRDPEFFHGNQ